MPHGLVRSPLAERGAAGYRGDMKYTSPTNNPLRVCFALDPGFLRPTLVALYSLTKSTRNSLEIHIIGVDFKKEHWLAVEQITNIRKDIAVAIVRHPLNSCDFPLEVKSNLGMLARLLLPNLSKGRMIYLDGDIIVNSDLEELFYTDLQQHPIGVCQSVKNLFHYEHSKGHPKLIAPLARVHGEKKLSTMAERLTIKKPENYINSGVLLMNLDLLSKSPYYEKITDLKAAAKLRMPDQTWLYKCFADDMVFLNLKWNTFRGNYFTRQFFVSREFRRILRESRREAAIIHFIGPQKPWKRNYPFFNNGMKWFRLWHRLEAELSSLRPELTTYLKFQ